MDYSVTFYVNLEDPSTHFRRAPTRNEIDFCVDEKPPFWWGPHYRLTCSQDWPNNFTFNYNVLDHLGNPASSLTFSSLLDWGCIDTWGYKCYPIAPLAPVWNLFGHVYLAANRSIKYTFMDLVLEEGDYNFVWPVTATLLVPNLSLTPPVNGGGNGGGNGGDTWGKIEEFIEEHWKELAIGGAGLAVLLLLMPGGGGSKVTIIQAPPPALPKGK